MRMVLSRLVRFVVCYASTSHVVIVRTSGGRAQRIPIDYDAILSGDSPEQDIVILAGDAVRVP